MTTEKINNVESFRRVKCSLSSGASDFVDTREQEIFSSLGPKNSEGFRCKMCGRLLAKKNCKGAIAGEIKCPRCGAINEI